jgi:thiopeptide-type bacteriocin biosynthesis protein
MYRCVDAAVLRAATDPFGGEVPPSPDVTETTSEHLAQWRRWLRQVWAVEEFAAAVELASPVLARRVRAVCDGDAHQPRDVRRALFSVIRYVLRATGRATPFGLFAGVATARFGSAVAVHEGACRQTVARIDSEWLAGLIVRLESCPELRCRLPVIANNLAFVRDGRLVAGCQQSDTSGQAEPVEVSVRYTRAVRTITESARVPIPIGELAGKLATEFPRTAGSTIDRMLAELVARRILVTSLRPPTTATRPLAHLIDALTAADADAVPEAAPLLAELRRIYGELARHDQAHSPGEQRAIRTAIARRMTAIAPAERPVAVDLRLDYDLALPDAVAREAETAAAALVRLTPHPSGLTAWRDYHGRFLERYGVGALVPVAELVNPDTGLGFPAGYRDTCLKPPPGPGVSQRDEALLGLAQKAAMEQRVEIVLDDQAIADLADEDDATASVQPHTELRFRVHAPKAAAIENGEFELSVAGVSRAAGTTAGRFLDLFDGGDRDRMFGAYASLPTANEDALPVQLSCPPLYPRTENVARSPRVLPHLVSFAEYHASRDDVIGLDDLAVGGDAQWLCLFSLSRRRSVEPLVFSAVEFANHAHPLMRFLSEISSARMAACAPFSWGAAGRLPFLPRVRYRRTILAPARWTLTVTDVLGPGDSLSMWAEALAVWRQRWRVPDTVYLGEGDRRLRLNLTEPAHLSLLRTELDRGSQITLREAPPPGAFGWLNGRAHEIVVPLAATNRPKSRPAWRGTTISREHGHLPAAGGWLYVKLYGHPKRQTAILTTHVPRLLSTWNTPRSWWFLRYHDPEPHLRLRIRLRNPDEFGETAQAVGAWAADLRRLGLIGQVQWDTYYPETGRFGDGAAMAAAEELFAADSAVAVAQLTHVGPYSDLHEHAITAASLVDLAISATGGIREGMTWLVDHIPTNSSPAAAREVHDQAIRLGHPRDGWAALRASPGGEGIFSAWSARRAALAQYRAAFTGADGSGPEAVLPDLLHLHHVRMTGISPGAERACARLARAAALSWRVRTQGAP